MSILYCCSRDRPSYARGDDVKLQMYTPCGLQVQADSTELGHRQYHQSHGNWSCAAGSLLHSFILLSWVGAAGIPDSHRYGRD